MEEQTGAAAKITAFFKGGKATRWIVALGVIGIGLILLPRRRILWRIRRSG